MILIRTCSGLEVTNMRMDEIKKKKKAYDPYDLLNPGKIPKTREVI